MDNLYQLYLIFGIVSFLVSILANSRKARKEIIKGWNLFTKWLQSLDGYEEGEPSPPPALHCIRVVDNLSIGLNDGYINTPLPLRLS